MLAFQQGQTPLIDKGLGSFTESKLFPIHSNESIGIAHTRWATSSAPSLQDAHPISGGKPGNITCWVVHNGIISNYKELRQDLERKGFVFSTGTDSEVIAHLFSDLSSIKLFQGGFLDAKGSLSSVFRILKGQFAFALISTVFPNMLFVAANDAPMVVTREGYCASDSTALSGYTTEAWRLKSGYCGILEKDGKPSIAIFDKNGVNSGLGSMDKITVPDSVESSLGDYPHYMLKEIEEQQNIKKDKDEPLEVDESEVTLSNITLFGCGSSYHAGMIGKKYFNDLAKIPSRIEYATDIVDGFIRDGAECYFALTQSGETQDTIKAIERIKEEPESGAICCITNNPNSRAASLCDEVVELYCGPEKGVAATKTYTYQLIRLLEISGEFGNKSAEVKALLNELPQLIKNVIVRRDDIAKIAKDVAGYKHIIFLGRHYLYPAAKEAALKMKEVAYIHAEAMTAAEMKHGPLALIDEKTLCIMLACGDNEEILDKIIGNISEIKARNGRVIVFCDEKAYPKFAGKDVFPMLSVQYLHPMVFGVAMQLLAYEVAIIKKINPDRPRSLAKSITVD